MTIVSKPWTREYEEGYELAFGKEDEKVHYPEPAREDITNPEEAREKLVGIWGPL